MHVKPAQPDVVIRDPVSRRPIPADGAEVPESTFWLRRLAAGDVVLVPATPDVLPVIPTTDYFDDNEGNR